jgi:hypothetical protein
MKKTTTLGITNVARVQLPERALLIESGVPRPLQRGCPQRAKTQSARKPTRSLDVLSLRDVKFALVFEGLLPVDAVFPAQGAVPRLPAIDDLELPSDLPTVKPAVEPVPYAGGRYELPQAVEVEPGRWSADVKFGANGRWVQRLSVDSSTAEGAQMAARRVLEVAVKNQVSLEHAYLEVSGT